VAERRDNERVRESLKIVWLALTAHDGETLWLEDSERENKEEYVLEELTRFGDLVTCCVTDCVALIDNVFVCVCEKLLDAISVVVMEAELVSDRETETVSDEEALDENESEGEGSCEGERDVEEVADEVGNVVADDDFVGIDHDNVLLTDCVSESSDVTVGGLGDDDVDAEALLGDELDSVEDALSVIVLVKVSLQVTVDERAPVFVGMLTDFVVDAVLVAPVSRPTRLVTMLSVVSKNTRRSLTVVGLEGEANFASDVAYPS
jgi:hypothetical protein